MNIQSYPISNSIEYVTFNLAGGASRDGFVMELRDWYGSDLGEFSDARKTGWPILDLAIRPPGNVNVIVQLGTDGATFFDWQTVAVAGGSWGTFSIRIPGRFARVRVTDTSGVANNGINLWQRLASQ